MPMSKEAMASFIENRINNVDHTQTTDPAAAQDYQHEMLLAFCQGIIDELYHNADVITVSGAPDSEHTGVLR